VYQLPITDPVLIFTVITTVILLSPLIGAKLRIPDLVLMLLAGAALGQHGFGVLERNEAIILFGEIGLLYIMFLAGLEIDLYQFSRTKGRSIGFGLITFLLPQVIGAVAVYYILGNFTWAAATLMASMFASHTLLAYPVASKLGIHKSEPVTISVGATIITDTLALLVLAVVVDANQDIALNFEFWSSLLLAMVILVVCISFLIPKLARWFFQHAGESGGTQFLFVLTVVCACAYFSQYARMKPIIGAFLAGAAFNRQIPEHSTLMNRLEFVGKVLFIPFFLISVGMLVDPKVLLGDRHTWEVIGVMVGAVVVTKWLAAMVGGWMFKYTFAERQVVFGLSVVQAAATLAAVLVGFEEGILNEQALNGAIAMIVVTVPLGSFMVQKYGRKMALVTENAPSVSRVEQRMMLLVDSQETADDLMDLGMLLRDPALPGGLFPVTIVPDDAHPDQALSRGEKLLARCVANASSAEVTVEPHVRMDINPVDGMIRAMRELRAGTVITGWGKESTRGSRLFGGVLHNLTARCASRIICCRLLQPLNTNKRLRIPFPPMSEHRSDLTILIRETKLLAKQAGLDLYVYLTGPSAKDIQTRFEKAGPGVETAFITGETWKETRQKLFSDLHKSDLLIVPQIRRDTRLWTPTLDKIPELIVQTFPDVNFMLVYPSLYQAQEVIGPVALPASDAFPALRGVDLGRGVKNDARITALVQEGLPEDENMAKEAVPLLVDSAKFTPVELADGVLLLHAHCGERGEPLLLIGCGEGDGSFFDQEQTPRILVVLLSPRGDAPELHLRSLAKVAKKFREPGFAEQLDAAGNAQEVCIALSGADL
jgi:Kef-type K+ transport system membrane component KefB